MTLFSILSNFLYIIGAYPITSFAVIFMIAAVSYLVLRVYRKSWQATVTLMMVFSRDYGQPFWGQWTNVSVLYGFGVRGEAIIIDRSSVERSFAQGAGKPGLSSFVTTYGIKVKDGTRMFSAKFSDHSPPFWPLHSVSPFPKEGDRLTVKYIPGAEQNIAILLYESAYLLEIWQERLRRSKDHYEAFPDALNRLSYTLALREFLEKFRITADPNIVSQYQADLSRLDTSSDRPMKRIDEEK